MDLTALLALFEAAVTLKRVPRSGWLLRGVPHVESVADHSYGTALVALALADVLNASHDLPQPLDTGRLLTIAVLHDLAEARLTDLPSPVLRYISREAKQRAEATILQELIGGLPSASELLSLWEEFETGSSPEGRLVRDADRLEMLAQCLRYEQAGCRTLGEFWATGDETAWHYPLCARLYAQLRAARPAQPTPS